MGGASDVSLLTSAVRARSSISERPLRFSDSALARRPRIVNLFDYRRHPLGIGRRFRLPNRFSVTVPDAATATNSRESNGKPAARARARAHFASWPEACEAAGCDETGEAPTCVVCRGTN